MILKFQRGKYVEGKQFKGKAIATNIQLLGQMLGLADLNFVEDWPCAKINSYS